MNNYDMQNPERTVQEFSDDAMFGTMTYRFRHTIDVRMESHDHLVRMTGQLALNNRGEWSLYQVEIHSVPEDEDQDEEDAFRKYLRDFGAANLITAVNPADAAWAEYVARWYSLRRAEGQHRYAQNKLEIWEISTDFTQAVKALKENNS